MLRLSDIAFNYGSARIIQDISLDISEGEAVGIVGPNGAGKTTLFNLISGDLSPKSGSVFLFGQDVSRLPSRRRARMRVARTYQIPLPFMNMTVLENLMVGACNAGGLHQRNAKSLSLDVLKQTDLHDKANFLAGRLNLLDRKRLELARAIATQPRILLLDEIAGGLSDHECEPLVRMLHDIRASGVTLVWIEHVLHALVQVVERVVALDTGKLTLDGPVTEIMASASLHEMYLGVEHGMAEAAP